MVLLPILAPPAPPTVVLRVGQGVRFSTGKVTPGKEGADVVFGVMEPQRTSGNRYNVATGRYEYEAGVTTSPSAALSAKKVGTFDTRPDSGALAADPMDKWGERKGMIRRGQWVVVQAIVTGRTYLLRVVRLTMPKYDPRTWRMSLSYEPFSVG